MDSIWYYYDYFSDPNEGRWIKMKYRPEKSGLNDIFEFMEEDLPNRIKKGSLLDMYYGSMANLMRKDELISEEQFKKKEMGKCYKNAYESEGMALVVIDKLIESRVRGSDKLSVYKCDECEMWHLTSNS